MMRRRDPLHPPDGIAAADVDRGSRKRASPFSLIVLGGIVVWGLSGYAGGDRHRLHAEAAAARLSVDWPAHIRNGEIYEATIRVEARRPIGKVVLALGDPLLRQTTLNSTTPEPSEQSYDDGSYRFEYGPLEPGRSLLVKLDAQINPVLFGENAGAIRVLDDRVDLVGVDLAFRVLP